MDKIDRLINIIRNLKEEGEVPVIANSTNSPGGPINIAGLPPDEPPIKKRKRYIYPKNVKGYRSIWRQQ
jgi:hypothetical protein